MTSKLEIQEIPTTSCKYLRLADSSYYNPKVEVTNALLEVKPPGFRNYIVFHVEKDFSKVLNASNLKIAPTVKSSLLTNLPDGIYSLKYSINPNAQVYVEYDHLRICLLMQKYYKAICDLYGARCVSNRKDYNSRTRELIHIKHIIDAAKIKAEECGDPEGGIELYNEANRLLDIKNDCAC